MRKTSVYLSEAEAAQLRQLAEALGRPQSQIIREAIASYARSVGRDRRFALARAGAGPGGTVADVAEEVLLDGFGT